MQKTATTGRKNSGKTPEDRAPAEVARRLVVELNNKSVEDLTWLVSEEGTTKTTIVNRALQVYKRIMELQAREGGVVLEDPERGTRERLLFV